MRGSSLGYLIKEGARNVYANRLMSLASIGVLMACLMLIGSAYLLSENVNNMLGYAESQNEVVIFLEDDASKSDIERMEKSLEGMENIDNIVFVSKEDALEEQKEVWKNAKALLEGIEDDENFLPDSFRVTLYDLTLLEETTSELSDLDNVDEVVAPVEAAGLLTQIQTSVSLIGSIIIMVLAIVSVVIIANTTKLTVFTRSREINIMKLCGATNTFIILPFIIEGMLLGLIAASLAFLVLWGGYSYTIHWINQSSMVSWMGAALGHILQFEDAAPVLATGFFGGGGILGAFSSVIFIRKHLKV